MKLFLMLLLTTFMGVVACTDVNVLPAAPTEPEEPIIITNKIEFRVFGNATSAKIRFSNQFDGLAQTVSSLPFVTSFITSESSLFLSLDVTPISYPTFNITNPFLSAQIVVDGNLFREATSNEFELNTLTVAGTWRR